VINWPGMAKLDFD